MPYSLNKTDIYSYSPGSIANAGSLGAIVTYVGPTVTQNGTVIPATTLSPVTYASNVITVSGTITSDTGTLADSTVGVSGLLSFDGQEGVDVRYGSTIVVPSGGNVQSSVVALEAGQGAALSVAAGGTVGLTGGASGPNGQEGLLDNGYAVLKGGSLQSPNAVLEVGVSGAGTFAVQAGGQATTGFSEVGGQGTLGVSGAGALFQSNATGTLVDNGQVSVDGSATLSVGNATLGEAAGDAGYAMVSAAAMTLANTLTMGESGAGTLSIQNNASLQTGGNVELGAQSGGSGLFSLGSGASARVQGNLSAGASAGGTGSVAIDGGTTTLTVEGDTAIGEGGTGTLALTGGASLLAVGALDIGSAGATNGLGSASVAGVIVASNDLSVDNGSLSLATTGTLAVSGALSAGDAAGGTGSIALAAGAQVTDIAGVTVGGAGTGSLAATGATINAPGADFSVGESAGGNGNASITGGLLNVASMAVGSAGNGAFDLSGNATVSVANDVAVGDSLGGIGVATLSGAGSIMTVGNGLTVGGQGNGGLVVSGAQLDVVHGDISVGESAGGSGALTVNTGSLAAAGNLDVGSAGQGVVELQLGANLGVLPDVSVGESATGSGLLSLDFGMLQAQTLSLGGYGQATLELAADSVLTTNSAAIAEQATGYVQRADINQSTWQVAQSLVVGDAGQAQVTISNGGAVFAQGSFGIGGKKGAAGTVDATGGGSTVDFSSLVVGDGGSGTLLLQNGATSAPVKGQIGTIEIAAQGGSVGTIALSGGSDLTGATLDVGGAGTSEGGAGLLTIDTGASVSVTDVTVFGHGTVVLSGGTLASSPVTVEAGGTIGGTGTISGNVTSEASILADRGRLEITGSIAGTGDVVLQTGADLAVGTGIAATQTIDGLTTYQETLDLRGLAFTARQMTTLASGDTLTISNGSQAMALTMGNSTGLAYRLGADGSGGTELSVACYAHGTRVLTRDGEVAVEHLAVGDRVATLSGGLRAVRWIGRRGYDGRFAAGNPLVLPVTIRAGALGRGLPWRDLTVSPMHALLIDGALVPAVALVNGTSIVHATSVEAVAYVHVELDGHDILFAEGVAAESFRDDGNRGQFANARTARGGNAPVASCAPVVTGGALVERLRRRIGGLGEPGEPGSLIGHVDTVSDPKISGWALDLANPAHGVVLEAFVGGQRIGASVANWWRPDLARAGYGTGHHGFEFVPPDGIAAADIVFRRAADGAPLAAHAGTLTAIAPIALAG
ncbi:MAG: Hint domain-containing protein [Rhodospirillales bacterium]|nr:Hint domain-containing protein [Rhodospirillales bacterium]